MELRLLIIRHGEPDYTTDSLTPQGKIEAAALARHLASQKVKVVYSSPRGRALETARYTADMLGTDIQVEDWTREFKELWVKSEGKMVWDFDGQIFRNGHLFSAPYQWEGTPPMDHPNLKELWDRTRNGSDDFLARLGFVRHGGHYEVTRANTDQVAVFCHAGFGMAWVAHLLALPLHLVWSGFFVHTSSVTTILFEERQPGIAVPRCIGLGDVSHLHKEEIPPSHMGLKANFE